MNKEQILWHILWKKLSMKLRKIVKGITELTSLFGWKNRLLILLWQVWTCILHSLCINPPSAVFSFHTFASSHIWSHLVATASQLMWALPWNWCPGFCIGESVMMQSCLGTTKKGNTLIVDLCCVLSFVTEGFVHSTAFPAQSFTRYTHSATCTSHVKR